MRVGALYRLSTKESVERQMGANLNPGDDVDIPGQRIAVQRFLDKKSGWELVKEYVEPAVSAYKRTAASRDILQRAISDARAGLIEVLVVFKSDRLSRRSEEYPAILAELQAYGVAVWTVVEERPIPYKTHTDKLIAYVDGWKNEGESLGISQRSSERKLQKAEDGRWTGGPVPFGYKLETLFDETGQPVFVGRRLQRRLVANHGNAEEGRMGPADAIRELFERYVKGAGMPKLVKWMNSLPDIRPVKAMAWKINMVRNMLTNPLYAGIIRYGVRSDTDRHRADGVARVRTESKEPALITRELWDEAQRVQVGRAKLHSRAKMERYALSGVVKCGLCGSLLMGKSYPKKSRKGVFVRQYYYLRCGRYGAARQCSSVLHRMEAVEALILQELKQLVAPDGMIGLAAGSEAARHEAEERAQKQRAQWERRLVTVDEALLGLAQKRAENEFSRETYETLKAGYEREQVELQTNLATIAEATDGPDYRALAEATFQLVEQWRYMEVGQKKQVLLLVCEAWGHDLYVHQGPSIELRPRG